MEAQAGQGLENPNTAKQDDAVKSGYSKEDIDAAIRESLSKHKADLSEDQAQNIANRAAAQTRQAIVDSISGDSKKDKIDPITRELLLNGTSTMKNFADIIVEQVTSTVREENRVQQETRDEALRAAAKVTRERPDIVADTELFNELYDATDRTASPKERAESAVRKYDLIMEKATGKAKEDRIAEASSISSSASGTSGSNQANKPSATPEQFWKEEMEENLSRSKALRGGLV